MLIYQRVMVYLDTSIDHLIISIPSDCGFKTFIEETDPTVDGCENQKKQLVDGLSRQKKNS